MNELYEIIKEPMSDLYTVQQINLIGKTYSWGKNIHQQLNLFNMTIMNIFNNFIPNKTIKCDDRDSPWINDEVKNLIKLQR